MPYSFKAKEDLSSDERAKLGQYLGAMEREQFGSNNSDRDATYGIRGNIIYFTIYEGNSAIEHSVQFKIDDNGNIMEIDNDDFNAEKIDVSEDLKERIMDTLKNIVIESQDGGRRHKKGKRLSKTRKSKKTKKTKKSKKRRHTTRRR
jgi:hypothetical protein